jgi:hypothetical protein
MKRPWVQIAVYLVVLFAFLFLVSTLANVGVMLIPPKWRDMADMLICFFCGVGVGAIHFHLQSLHRKHVLMILQEHLTEIDLDLPDWLWKRIDVAIKKP